MSANFNPLAKVSGHFFIKWLIPLLGATGEEPVYLSLVVRIRGKIRAGQGIFLLSGIQ